MKIKIICEKKGWILYRIAEELKRRLKHWDIRINEKLKNPDINYFINYGYYREKSKSSIDVGWFTHYDPDVLSDRWLKASNEMDHCIAQSDLTKETLILQGIPRQKISVVILGADDSFSPKVRVGIVGRVYPGGRKGKYLIKELINDKKVCQSVCFVAKHDKWGVPVNDLEYEDFYNSIDFLLIPSLLEGGPVPFMEALACGKLAIAPPIGVIPKFDHIEYKTGDIRDLKRVVLQTCLPVYEKRCKIAAQVAKYNWNYFAKEHEKIFEKLYESIKPKGKFNISRLWSK